MSGGIEPVNAIGPSAALDDSSSKLALLVLSLSPVSSGGSRKIPVWVIGAV